MARLKRAMWGFVLGALLGLAEDFNIIMSHGEDTQNVETSLPFVIGTLLAPALIGALLGAVTARKSGAAVPASIPRPPGFWDSLASAQLGSICFACAAGVLAGGFRLSAFRTVAIVVLVYAGLELGRISKQNQR